MSSDLEGNVVAPPTGIADEDVDVLSPKYGPQGRSCLVLDPATGTLIVRPGAERKIEKALMREAKRIALRLQRKAFLLKLMEFRIECRAAYLRAQRYLLGRRN